MEKAKNEIMDLKLMLSDAVMGEDSVLSLSEIKKVFNKLKLIEGEIERAEAEREKEIIDIPKLPKGDKYNGFPRMVYATVCEFYSRDKFFSVYDLMEHTGSSRTQAKTDLELLEQDGFIKHIDGYTGERKIRYYKYKPTKL